MRATGTTLHWAVEPCSTCSPAAEHSTLTCTMSLVSFLLEQLLLSGAVQADLDWIGAAAALGAEGHGSRAPSIMCLWTAAAAPFSWLPYPKRN